MGLFNEVKTTQAAALLLKLRGGEMSYLKLVKLLYLVDRAALTRWGRPITFDQYFSMPQGQVLSHTLDLINDEGVQPGQEGQSYWLQHISEPSNYKVCLREETPVDELSKAEIELISEIFQQYGRLSRWQLRDLHHTLPEYVDPGDSHAPTDYETILRAVGKTESEIAAIVRELRYFESARAVLGK